MHADDPTRPLLRPQVAGVNALLSFAHPDGAGAVSIPHDSPRTL